jgi:hypothetical protein
MLNQYCINTVSIVSSILQSSTFLMALICCFVPAQSRWINLNWLVTSCQKSRACHRGARLGWGEDEHWQWATRLCLGFCLEGEPRGDLARKKNSAMVPLIPDSNMFPIMIFMEIWGMPNFGTNSIVCILGRLQDLVLCTPSRDRWFEVLFSQRKGVMMPLQGHPGNQQWNREMYCLVNRCK